MKYLIVLMLASPAAFFLIRALRRKSVVPAYGTVFYATFLGQVGRIGSFLSLANMSVMLLATFELALLAAKRRAVARWGLLDVCAVTWLLWAGGVTIVRGGMASDVRAAVQLSAFVLVAKLRPTFGDVDFRELAGAIAIGGIILGIGCAIQEQIDPTIYGLLGRPLGVGTIYFRVTGFFDNANAAAFYLVLAAGAVLVRFAAWRDVLWAVPALLGLAWSIVATQSRAGFIALAPLLLLRALWRFRARRGLVIAASILAPALLLVGESFRGWLEMEVFSTRPDFAATGRETRWKVAADVVARHPIIGDNTVLFDGEPIYYHNDVLQQACDFGLPAALLFALMLAATTWRAVIRARREQRASSGLLIMGMHVVGLVMSMTHGMLLSGICYWMMVALAHNSVALGPSRVDGRDRRPQAVVA